MCVSMKMSPYFREEVVAELRNIGKKMKQEPDLSKKLFFYSAAYGMTNRALRFEFDEELVLVDAVLTMSYGAVNNRMQMFLSGDRIVPITTDITDGLAKCVSDLSAAIEKDEECYEILQRIMTLTFLTTGPGHYMAIKGQIKMPRK